MPTQLGKHWWPHWALVSGVRVDYLSPTIYVTDLILVLLIIVVFATSNHKKFHFSWKTFFLWVFTRLLILHARNQMVALVALARYLEIPLVAWVTLYVARQIRPARRFIKLLISFLSIAGIFTVILEVIQLVTQKSTGLLWLFGERTVSVTTPGIATMRILGHEVLRPYATFSHPNALAGWLVVVFFIIRALAPHNKSVLIRAGIFVSVIGMFLTGSRIAIASFFFVIFSTYMLPMNFRSLTFGVAPLLSFAPQSVTERLALGHAALLMIAHHPLLGVGPGHFLLELPSYLPRNIWLMQPAHNVLLLLLAEFGVVGIALMTLAAWKFLKQILKPSPMRRVLLAIFLTSLGDHYWITAPQNRILFGIVLGLFFWSRSLRSSRRDD